MFGSVRRKFESNTRRMLTRQMQKEDASTLMYNPQLLGHDKMRYDTNSDFKPVGQEVGEFLTEHDAERYLVQQANILLDKNTTNPFVKVGLGNYIAQMALKQSAEERNKSQNALYALWLLGKSKELNDPSVTPWGASPVSLINPEANNFTQRAIKTQYMFNLFAYRLFIKAPLLNMKEYEWYFRYLVMPLRQWVEKRCGEHAGPVGGQSPDPIKSKPAYWWKVMKQDTCRKDYEYPSASLDPVYNHWFWTFAYKYVPTDPNWVLGNKEGEITDENMTLLAEIEMYTNMGDVKGWDLMYNQPLRKPVNADGRTVTNAQGVVLEDEEAMHTVVLQNGEVGAVGRRNQFIGMDELEGLDRRKVGAFDTAMPSGGTRPREIEGPPGDDGDDGTDRVAPATGKGIVVEKQTVNEPAEGLGNNNNAEASSDWTTDEEDNKKPNDKKTENSWDDSPSASSDDEDDKKPDNEKPENSWDDSPSASSDGEDDKKDENSWDDSPSEESEDDGDKKPPNNNNNNDDSTDDEERKEPEVVQQMTTSKGAATTSSAPSTPSKTVTNLGGNVHGFSDDNQQEQALNDEIYKLTDGGEVPDTPAVKKLRHKVRGTQKDRAAKEFSENKGPLRGALNQLPDKDRKQLVDEFNADSKIRGRDDATIQLLRKTSKAYDKVCERVIIA
jgi:hypothetical protein